MCSQQMSLPLHYMYIKYSTHVRLMVTFFFFTYPHKATFGCQTIPSCLNKVQRVREEKEIPLSIISIDVRYLVCECTFVPLELSCSFTILRLFESPSKLMLLREPVCTYMYFSSSTQSSLTQHRTCYLQSNSLQTFHNLPK